MLFNFFVCYIIATEYVATQNNIKTESVKKKRRGKKTEIKTLSFLDFESVLLYSKY